MECNAKYHIERYLDSKGIYVGLFQYKYEDIRDLVQECCRDTEYGLLSERWGSITDGEPSRRVKSPRASTSTVAGRHSRTTKSADKMPTTPPPVFIRPYALDSGSTAYSSSDEGTSSSGQLASDYSPSPPPRSQQRNPRQASLTSRREQIMDRDPPLPPTLLIPGILDAESDTSDLSSNPRIMGPT